jgi:signal transduction histidine kinase
MGFRPPRIDSSQSMRLAAFILANLEPILQEWEDFARDLGAVSESMDVKSLRDHAKTILQELAEDLETRQSAAQQVAKSKGEAPPPTAADPGTGAEQHGGDRAVEGFSLEQMVSEYRALRASVLRLWSTRPESHQPEAVEEVTRFNEAIDEALAESVQRYARDLKRLMATVRAQERMAALGTLSAGLGHDMSNVLLPMRMLLNELGETALPPEAASIVESLQRSMEHLSGLTQGLRALSVDPDDPEAFPETTELHAWWAEAMFPYKWLLGRGIQLHVEGLEPSLPPVRVPKHILMQAVFNLVQNAAEALVAGGGSGGLAGGGGNIWVSAKVAADGETVALTVRDDAPGMSPETLARCTEPFFTTRHRARGTGLGLALVRTTIERCGGRLAIESQPGEGSSFTLVLPVAKRSGGGGGGGGGGAAGRKRVIVTVHEPRVWAMVLAIVSDLDAEVVDAEAVDEGAGRGGGRGAVLWVADDPDDAQAVRRFLDEGGANARVIILGGGGGGAWGTALGDDAARADRIIQIDTPSYHALHGALRQVLARGKP